MISYTIDPSVFEPPPIPEYSNSKKKYHSELWEFLKTIENCYKFIHHEGKSVYTFHYYVKNHFDDIYLKNAISTGFPLPLDMYKQKLNDIHLFNMPELHYGDRIGSKKYYFEDWFEIKILNYEKSSVIPSLQDQQDDNSETYNRFNMIGILNNIVLKDSRFHYLLRKETIDTLNLESLKINFRVNKTDYFEESLSTEIKLKQINKINYKYNPQFKSVLNAIEHAKEIFNDCIIFGKDVEKGIKTIRDAAGPPDRIFAYLKTLDEFCKIKRSQKIAFSDAHILQVLGCICSNENEEDMKNEDFFKKRMFDNGNNEKILFNLHLKPNTFSEYEDVGNKKRTVRIYVFWENKQEKVIVGWIGKHL